MTDNREEYFTVAESVFQELQPMIMNLMKRLSAKHGNLNGDVVFFAVEMALMMHSADLAIFRKNKLGNAPGLNAKTFGELAALHFKEMLKRNK